MTRTARVSLPGNSVPAPTIEVELRLMPIARPQFEAAASVVPHALWYELCVIDNGIETTGYVAHDVADDELDFFAKVEGQTWCPTRSLEDAVLDMLDDRTDDSVL